jgi:hypothetical protein
MPHFWQQVGNNSSASPKSTFHNPIPDSPPAKVATPVLSMFMRQRSHRNGERRVFDLETLGKEV